MGGNAIQLKRDTRTENSSGEHVLPVVPVVVDQRHPHHCHEDQRHGDDAELGAVESPVERLDLAVQVPQQEAQPGKKPCTEQVTEQLIAIANMKGEHSEIGPSVQWSYRKCGHLGSSCTLF